jgi:hypothetical protein
MFAKVKPQVFLDSLSIEYSSADQAPLNLQLKDDKGCICRSMDSIKTSDEGSFYWRGLNDLPYGVYTLEITDGDELFEMRLVKRV